MPTARNATSLTIDSVAIASISPSWCSVASMWRVPNSTANSAIASATRQAISPSTGCIAPLAGPIWTRMVVSEVDTAFSCSAMYGIVPMIAISATIAATVCALP